MPRRAEEGGGGLGGDASDQPWHTGGAHQPRQGRRRGVFRAAGGGEGEARQRPGGRKRAGLRQQAGEQRQRAAGVGGLFLSLCFSGGEEGVGDLAQATS